MMAAFSMSPRICGSRRRSKTFAERRQLPRALRRLGSVGCLACHGPSALPEEGARWSILRSDVCAHCHDAPPRYGHVVAWQSTSMARADRDQRARLGRASARLATRRGAFWAKSVRAQASARTKSTRRAAPAGVGAVGISCAACHAVHTTSSDSERAQRHLLRVPHLSAMFDDVPAEARAQSATCIACHAPRDAPRPLDWSGEARRRQSRRLRKLRPPRFWVGRAGVDPETGAPLTGPAPHLSRSPGGCVGCHGEGPDGHRTRQRPRLSRRSSSMQLLSRHVARSGVWADERARIDEQARKLMERLARAGDIGAREASIARIRRRARRTRPRSSETRPGFDARASSLRFVAAARRSRFSRAQSALRTPAPREGAETHRASRARNAASRGCPGTASRIAEPRRSMIAPMPAFPRCLALFVSAALLLCATSARAQGLPPMRHTARADELRRAAHESRAACRTALRTPAVRAASRARLWCLGRQLLQPARGCAHRLSLHAGDCARLIPRLREPQGQRGSRARRPSVLEPRVPASARAKIVRSGSR